MKHMEYLNEIEKIQNTLNDLNEALKKELKAPNVKNFEAFDNYVESLSSAAKIAADLREASSALVQEYATGTPAQKQKPVEEVPAQEEVVTPAPAQEINMQEIVANAVTGITALASIFQAFRKR